MTIGYNIGVFIGAFCMSVALEKRVAALEREVARLQRQASIAPAGRAWVDDLYGKFAGDPLFDKAMKLGRRYRESLRPRGRGQKSKR
jgi:hypothetical protein